MKTAFAFLAFTLLLFSQASASPLPLSNDAPVDVSADNMIYNSDKNTVSFTGNVEAVRGEFKLWAESLTIYLKNSGRQQASSDDAASLAAAMGSTDLERIVAETNVRFKNGTQSGTAHKATYFAGPNTLVLEGRPILRDGANSITGNVIRYFINENRSVVEGGASQRVHAVFSSNQKKKGK